MKQLSLLGAPRNVNAIGIFLVFLIAHVTTALSAIITYGSFHRHSPKIDNQAVDNRNRLDDYVPRKWRDVPPEPRAPQIDIHLLKGHILPEDENWGFSVEYKYSSNKFKGGNMETVDREQNYGKEANKDEESNVDEAGVKIPQDNQVPIVPQLESRRVVTSPSYCLPGERKDANGKCRPIMRG